MSINVVERKIGSTEVINTSNLLCYIPFSNADDYRNIADNPDGYEYFAYNKYDSKTGVYTFGRASTGVWGINEWKEAASKTTNTTNLNSFKTYTYNPEKGLDIGNEGVSIRTYMSVTSPNQIVNPTDGKYSSSSNLWTRAEESENPITLNRNIFEDYESLTVKLDFWYFNKKTILHSSVANNTASSRVCIDIHSNTITARMKAVNKTTSTSTTTKYSSAWTVNLTPAVSDNSYLITKPGTTDGVAQIPGSYKIGNGEYDRADEVVSPEGWYTFTIVKENEERYTFYLSKYKQLSIDATEKSTASTTYSMEPEKTKRKLYFSRTSEENATPTNSRFGMDFIKNFRVYSGTEYDHPRTVTRYIYEYDVERNDRMTRIVTNDLEYENKYRMCYEYR